ncbi:plasmid mobilization protein [Coprobacillus cateniformis]|uniref:plasmid mobilization protein n=1 Tax=Coprobacillus cateniformis TaxID=100884 RepID=UPI00241BF72D|nr:plasmid mobilization relaxosome protein MobC [Coprobacillus cateniformis]
MKRNHEIKIRFNDNEFKILNNKLEKTSLSREAFSRACILGKEIKVPPDLDYYKLKNEFNYIGNNLNQIARALNNRQDISLKIIMETIKEFRQMIKNLDEKVRG